jgi:DNA-binding NtrC family response regulator
VDVRIIAATHRDLQAEVQRKVFRQDLFYRLNVVSVKLPALRERVEDLPALAHHFVKKSAARFEKNVTKLDPETLERLCSYGWPGNVRELENAMERAVVLARTDVLTPDLLPSELRPSTEVRSISSSAPQLPLSEARADFERNYLNQALRRAEGNTAEAARLSGVDRSNFRRLLKRHGISASSAKTGT